MGETAVENKMQLGQLLQARGVVTADQIEHALAEQKDKGHRKLLGELLVEMEYCTENQIASALAEAYDVPYAQITPKVCDVKTIESSVAEASLEPRSIPCSFEAALEGSAD